MTDIPCDDTGLGLVSSVLILGLVETPNTLRRPTISGLPDLHTCMELKSYVYNPPSEKFLSFVKFNVYLDKIC